MKVMKAQLIGADLLYAPYMLIVHISCAESHNSPVCCLFYYRVATVCVFFQNYRLEGEGGLVCRSSAISCCHFGVVSLIAQTRTIIILFKN